MSKNSVILGLGLVSVSCTPETIVVYETAGGASSTGGSSAVDEGAADAPSSDETGCVGEGCGGPPPCVPAAPDPYLPYPGGTHMGVTQGYGCARTHVGQNHYSYDFNVSGGYELAHDLVTVASSPGVVTEVVDWVEGSCYGLPGGCGPAYNDGWGNCVVVEVSGSCGEVFERYCHLDTGPGAIFVEEGEVVCRGTPLGRIGNTGNSSNSHIHWQRENELGQSEPVQFQENVTIEGVCGEICNTPSHLSGCYESENFPPPGCEVDEPPPPPPGSPCEGLLDGDYCGSNRELDGYRGGPDDLVTCSGGAIASVEPCVHGCLEMPPGTHDVCAGPPGPTCGNGTIEPGETCDGGNLDGATCGGAGFDAGVVACTPGCQLDFEGCCVDECAIGDNTCGGAGQSSCQMGAEGCAVWSDPTPCPEGCDGDTCYNPSCGNGVADPGEACDGADMNGQSCVSLGFDGGSLSCTGGCTLNTGGCYACGDGSVDPGESCDGGDLGGQSCGGLGFDGGVLACNGSCNYNTSGCFSCGDGSIDPGESCDGFDLGGQSCLGLGYDGGILQCSGSCNYDTGGCCSQDHSILNAEFPFFTSDGSGCTNVGGISLNLSAQHLNPSTIRFRIRKNDGTTWGAPALLRLYVGIGPTCGNPPNVVKEVEPVVVGVTEQIIDLTVDPYDAAWSMGEVKEFWVGKSEGPWEAARSTGTVSIQRVCN